MPQATNAAGEIITWWSIVLRPVPIGQHSRSVLKLAHDEIHVREQVMPFRQPPLVPAERGTEFRQPLGRMRELGTVHRPATREDEFVGDLAGRSEVKGRIVIE